MIHLNLFLNILFPATDTGYFVSGWNMAIFGLLFIAVFLIAIYFITGKYKRNFAFERNAFMKEINDLKMDNEKLRKELDFLKSKLHEIENERATWNEEKETLLRKIKDLEDQIMNLTKSDNTEKEDIIIEYYMNQKSND